MIKRREILAAGLFATTAAAVSGAAAFIGANKREMPAKRGQLLERIPLAINHWQFEPSREDMIDPVVVDGAFAEALRRYDLIVARDYVDAVRQRIMLNACYMHAIQQETRFHQPESCYSTQGFQVQSLEPQVVDLGFKQLTLTRFLATRQERREVACYWMRIGKSTPETARDVRMAIFRNSLGMALPDGVMVRTSIICPPEMEIGQASAIIADFVVNLSAASALELRPFLWGDT
ncbi:EpsI family protein [Sphingobium phenoxybenzoativorans]|uniref:EpsI family protein n=1 Tax=Sphingobium phenoxybenzoativorans TaxID=1592790 RepID=A0A975K6F9_9SPHN|nr:exosortase C-terminal domain/associated protein EpsI [Sphingobium phenoxybenzoativorans]QUT05654.1 EpsI family protein [Sphingobium phenoxybenzoativorans]